MEPLKLNASTATAHLAWDRQWQTEAGRADWLTPEPRVLELAHRLSMQASARNRPLRVLDLGCGVGRHTLPLAQLGLETYAIDGSDTGLSFARKAAEKADLTVVFTQGSMLDLPYADGFFDYVLAFNVVYHGDRPVVQRAIAEIHRILQPGGLFQGTMLSKRHRKYGLGHEIAPNTFVISDDADKDHPHFYCNAIELCQLYEGFELFELIDQEHESPGTWHWHLLAERLA